ncbi:MAG TPA: sugar ABC transporter permease [Streptosporangiaceae bacterium]|nr:sugar ABC transporter permease [Streptosporangiaceae bacterium]
MSAPLRGRILPYILVSPLVVFIGVLSFVPTVATTVEAFFRVMPLDPPNRFIGFGNFRALFANSVITTSWINTALYAAIGVVLSVVFGTVIAVALRRRFRFRGVILALVILPWALPAVVEAVIWSWIYNPTFGVMNSALHSAHAIGGYHLWLGLDRWLTIALIEVVQVWQITPLSALIILASLQAIPQELYEAAKVDGAGAVQQFFRISLPLIRSAVAVSIVEALVLSLNVFDQVYILNGIAPLGSSVMLQTYIQTFENLNFGGGYALSLLVTIATALVSLGALALLYRRTEAV